MRSGVLAVSFLLGAALVGAIILAVQPAPDDAPVRPAGVGAGGTPATRQAPADAAAEQMRRWAAVSLDRPLFSPDRHPIAQTPAGPNGVTGLPRLSGIMITPTGRRAIFAATHGGKPDVVVEGGSLGRYLVQSISVGEVVVIGPDGRHSLHPTFDGTLPVAVAAPPAVAGWNGTQTATASGTNPNGANPNGANPNGASPSGVNP
jgi:hypothetical protein